MINFNKPKDINGHQLRQELVAVNIKIGDEPEAILIDGNGDFWLDIDAKDTAKAQEVLDAHIPKPIPEPTIEDKLASVGLNLDDLKEALGL